MENLTTPRSLKQLDTDYIQVKCLQFPKIESDKVIVTAKALDDWFAQLYGYSVTSIPEKKPRQMPQHIWYQLKKYSKRSSRRQQKEEQNFRQFLEKSQSTRCCSQSDLTERYKKNSELKSRQITNNSTLETKNPFAFKPLDPTLQKAKSTHKIKQVKLKMATKNLWNEEKPKEYENKLVMNWDNLPKFEEVIRFDGSRTP